MRNAISRSQLAFFYAELMLTCDDFRPESTSNFNFWLSAISPLFSYRTGCTLVVPVLPGATASIPQPFNNSSLSGKASHH
ncbi:MAG: hypothetical protein ABI416_04980 [Ginsengibacter sp.]